jgi:rubrerythrin
MVFSQETLPPIIEQAILEIKNNNGIVTRKEFKKILYKLRITSEDVSYYRKYLESINYISADKKSIRLKFNDHPIKGIYLTCPDCGYSWNYKGKNYRAECPLCKHNQKKDIWIKVDPTSSNLTPTSSI